MFYECKSLKEFHLISDEEEISKKENKDKNIKYKDSFDDLNNQSNIQFLSLNNNNLTNLYNEAIKISNDNNEKEKNNFIIKLNNDFLSPS